MGPIRAYLVLELTLSPILTFPKLHLLVIPGIFDDANSYDDYMRLMKSVNSKNLKQQLGKIQNVAYTDPLTQNNLAHAALDGTILDSDLLVEVLQELYDKGQLFSE